MVSRYALLAVASLVAETGGARAASAEGADAAVTAAVSRMFDAVRDGDRAGFDAAMAPGFHIFERGEDLTADQIFSKTRQLFDHGVRIEWSVTSPEVVIDGDLAAVCYVNRGAITRDGKRQPVEWLETAVLRRIDGRWRIAFMQSERAKGSEKA